MVRHGKPRARWLGLLCACAWLGACGDAPPRGPDHRVLSYRVCEGVEDAARGDFFTPSLRHAAISVDPRFRHVLAFQLTPMLPPRRDPIRSQGPLVLYSDDLEVIVVSPLDHFFESLVYLEGGAVQLGLEGELEAIPAGLEHRFLWVEGRGLQATLERWGELMREAHGRQRTDRYADRGLSHLGYWTDNGSAYYYATAPGLSEQDTLLAVLAEARALGVPYGYLQLDSWWYHKAPGGSPVRPWLGLLRWEPQPDMFPAGLEGFQASAGLPIVAHNRWFAPENDYLAFDAWVVEGDFALPLGRPVFDRLVRDAGAWGLATYEQDWLANQFWGLGHLRSGLGRAERWMADLHAAVAARGLTMQLCMAAPAHLLDALDRPAVTTIRTSIDYAPSLSKESYWPQFHTVSMLAWALGLLPFKDTFRSREAHPVAEALVSTLSAGMVGPGDALGETDAELLLATCRADGLLLKPDRPAFPLDAMFLPHQRPYTTLTWSERPGLGRWLYVAAYHLASEHPDRTAEDRLWVAIQYEHPDAGRMFVYPERVRDFGIELAELGVQGPVVAYDWRTGRAWRAEGRLELPRFEGHYDFAYLVLAPILPNGLALVGEPGKFTTLADRRFREVRVERDAVRVRLEGAPGEAVRLRAYDLRAGALLPDVEVELDQAGEAEARVGR